MIPYSFDHDVEVDRQIIRSTDLLEPLEREMLAAPSLCWDVETSGLSPWRNHIVGHALAWRRPNAQIRAVYLPVRHRPLAAFDSAVQLPIEAVNKVMAAGLSSPAVKVGHNLQFDVLFGLREGLPVRGRVHDTLVCAKLIDENRPSYKLHNCLEHAGVAHVVGWKNELDAELRNAAKALHLSVTGLKDKHGYEFCTVETLGHYALQDAVYEYRLAESQLPYTHHWASIWAMEMRLFWVCVDIARVGVPIVPAVLERLAQEQELTMANLAPQIWHLAGGEQFDISNDTALRRILFDKLGFASRGQTRGHLNRVDDDVLWDLEVTEGSKIAGLIREHNDAEKVVSTYTRGVVACADAHNILHPELDQGGAKTGRMSCRNPNLQNIPIRTALGRRVREAFVARPGMIRYCLDFSQVELRVLAHLCQDPILLRVYREGLDAHKTTALEVFGTADVVDGTDMRRLGKILNFGTAFGMTEWGLMKNINKDLPAGQAPVDEVRAKQFLTAFYTKYAGITGYRTRLWHDVRCNSGLFNNLFGRPRRVPAIDADNEWARSAAERQVISTMVQGSTADLVKEVMVAVWDYLKSQSQCSADMVLMVHDDLQFDMDPGGSAGVIREVKRLMEHTCQNRLSVPIVVDAEYFTTNWKEKKKLKGFK
jgi:DNA polymerase-1